jgi:hypothetical protein
MLPRRTLMQVATKLAIGLGALFLVGVLLAAIPNHRAPAVEGVSVEPAKETQGTDPTKSPKKDVVQGMARKHAATPKTADSTK